MTKENKDGDKLKSLDIRKILINKTKIIYKNNNKKPFTNPQSNNYKNKENLLKNRLAFTIGINILNVYIYIYIYIWRVNKGL